MTEAEAEAEAEAEKAEIDRLLEGDIVFGGGVIHGRCPGCGEPVTMTHQLILRKSHYAARPETVAIPDPNGKGTIIGVREPLKHGGYYFLIRSACRACDFFYNVTHEDSDTVNEAVALASLAVGADATALRSRKMHRAGEPEKGST